MSSGWMDHVHETVYRQPYSSYFTLGHARLAHFFYECAIDDNNGTTVVEPQRFCFSATEKHGITAQCLFPADNISSLAVGLAAPLLPENDCIPTQQDSPWYTRPFVLLMIVTAVGSLPFSFACTLYERYFIRNSNKSSGNGVFQKVISAWSAQRSLQSIGQMPKEGSDTIRDFDRVWDCPPVMQAFLPGTDAQRFAEDMRHGPLAMLIANFTLSVDTYFVISGTLVAFAWFREQQKMKVGYEWPKWNSFTYWMHFYVHRILRLWPAYVFVMITTAVYSVIPPVQTWPWANPITMCSKYWWHNLLFINAIFPNYCMAWTWYLGAEMIFYVVSPIFLLTFRKSAMYGTLLCTLVITASSICRGWLTLTNNYPPFHMTHTDFPGIYDARTVLHHVEFYINPKLRIGPYLIGIMLGYCLASEKYKEHFVLAVESHKRHHFAINLQWVLIALGLLWPVFGTLPVIGWKVEGFIRAYIPFYAAVFRNVWGFSVAAIILHCHSGQATWLERVLGHRLWAPLAHCTYGTYLYHLSIIVGTFMLPGAFPLAWRGHLAYAPWWMLHVAAGYMSGLFTALSIEMPAARLQRVFLGRPVRRKDVSDTKLPELCKISVNKGDKGCRDAADTT